MGIMHSVQLNFSHFATMPRIDDGGAVWHTDDENTQAMLIDRDIGVIWPIRCLARIAHTQIKFPADQRWLAAYLYARSFNSITFGG